MARHGERVGCRAYSGTVTQRQLVFEQDFDLPRAIVWDGLVDPDLVSGWLGEARITAVPGGAYHLGWLGSVDFPGTEGAITHLSPPERLTVVTAAHGELDFQLSEVPGGSRDTSTRLRLTVTLEIDPAFEPRVRANWAGSLRQLVGLLRGHPVDWKRDQVEVRSASPEHDTGRR